MKKTIKYGKNARYIIPLFIPSAMPSFSLVSRTALHIAHWEKLGIDKKIKKTEVSILFFIIKRNMVKSLSKL